MKKTKKRGFLKYLFAKKYQYLDFLEPLIFLPFAFLIIKLMQEKFDLVTLVLTFALVFIYLPGLITAFEARKRTA